ncbi:MAG: tyrosine-type recombinase/integrase [Syntrophorhabdaceae bacterium]|nr:tyrosine-type recombinase/integrase [Syntrophorhabdaceae bacterium]
MRGSVSYQVHEIYNAIITFGCSKHQSKTQAKKSGASKMHEIGKGLNIYSYKTADRYRDIAKDLLKYVKENFRIKDIEKLDNPHVISFLQYKIDSGCSKTTMHLYCSAIEKLEVALNRYSELNHLGTIYHFDLTSIREQMQKMEKDLKVRSYDDPKNILNQIPDVKFQVAAILQYEAGLRISEAIHIREGQLKKIKDGFSLEIKGKGGKLREVKISKALGEAILLLMEDGLFQIDRNKYSSALKKACYETGQRWHGSHGLRHNYGQEKYLHYALQDPENAKQMVSKDLGHNRENITNTYLRI